MADSIYKVPTPSIGPDGKPIFDVFTGQEHIKDPNDPRLKGVNIPDLPTGQAPTGFQSQFAPVKLDIKDNIPADVLESKTTMQDIQTRLDEQTSRNTSLLNEALQRIQLSPEEKASQNRLLGLQQLQQQAIERVQERPLTGAILRSGLESEIRNISTGNTRESLVNLREQAFEAQRLQVLQGQRQQELEAIKLQLDQGNIDTQNIFKAAELQQQIETDYFNRTQTLSTNARQTLATLLDKFQGLTLDSISPESAAQIGILAQRAGIPLDIIRDGMNVLKGQIDIENAQKAFEAETARMKLAGGGEKDKKITAADEQSQSQIELINKIENHSGLDSRVGPNVFSRGLFSIQDRFGAGQDFAGQVHKMTSGLTLQSLIDAKERGATFGALSDSEMRILSNAATTISDWEKKDDKGVGQGVWNIDQASFKRELDVIRNLTQAAINRSAGYDTSLVNTDDVSEIQNIYGGSGEFNPADYYTP